MAWEFYANQSQHLAPCKSLVTPETNWSHQTDSCAKLLCTENMLVTHPKISAHVFYVSCDFLLWLFVIFWRQVYTAVCCERFGCGICVVVFADLLYVFVAVSLSLWMGDTAFMQIRGPLPPDMFLCLMGGPIDFASGKCCSQAETWNFEKIFRQRRRRGCRLKRGQRRALCHPLGRWDVCSFWYPSLRNTLKEEMCTSPEPVP